VKRWLVTPEAFEPVGREFRIAHRVHDVFVPEVMLNRAGVVTVVGELVTAVRGAVLY
jgi:hypothetical protein